MDVCCLCALLWMLDLRHSSFAVLSASRWNLKVESSRICPIVSSLPLLVRFTAFRSEETNE